MADDGPSGVDAVLRVVPDLAFVDLCLPGHNGYEVAASVRARRPGLATRLIALTGYGGEEEAKRAVEAGFDEHVVKPISATVLRELLEREPGR